MSLKVTIDQDLKQAMLGGDQLKASTLRILKSAILNEEIARGEREKGLEDDQIIVCLKREAKKRQEAAELYEKAGSKERAEKELSEKEIINAYLPVTMSDQEISALIDNAVSNQGELTQQNMGQVIGQVKQKSNGRADGADIARLVRAKLT